MKDQVTWSCIISGYLSMTFGDGGALMSSGVGVAWCRVAGGVAHEDGHGQVAEMANTTGRWGGLIVIIIILIITIIIIIIIIDD
jgi:hypothetical protein